MGAGAIGMMMTSPGQTYAVSVFIDYFIQDLHLSRGWVSSLYSIATLTGSFALPWVGRRIDRHGPRLMVVIISVAFGLACVYMGWIQNALMLGVGFVLIRMLGQGSLGIVSSNVINRWWVRRRGRANGISGVLVSLVGVGIFPTLIYSLIASSNWRMAYMALGGIVIVVMLPIGWLLFRNRPEDHGLYPDGEDPSQTSGDKTSEYKVEVHWTLAQARRTSVFWLLAFSAGSMSMLSTGLFFHMTSIFNDSGLSTAVAASAFVPIAFASALAHFGGGLALDRFPVRVSLVIALSLQILSLLMAPFLANEWMGYGYGILLGATGGLAGAINGVAWAQFFGRNHLGSIMGMVTSILVIGTALGPLPFGVGRDLLGSYDLLVPITALLPLTLAIICWFKLRRPTLST
jgi:MFS family permease